MGIALFPTRFSRDEKIVRQSQLIQTFYINWITINLSRYFFKRCFSLAFSKSPVDKLLVCFSHWRVAKHLRGKQRLRFVGLQSGAQLMLDIPLWVGQMRNYRWKMGDGRAVLKVLRWMIPKQGFVSNISLCLGETFIPRKKWGVFFGAKKCKKRDPPCESRKKSGRLKIRSDPEHWGRFSLLMGVQFGSPPKGCLNN